MVIQTASHSALKGASKDTGSGAVSRDQWARWTVASVDTERVMEPRPGPEPSYQIEFDETIKYPEMPSHRRPWWQEMLENSSTSLHSFPSTARHPDYAMARRSLMKISTSQIQIDSGAFKGELWVFFFTFSCSKKYRTFSQPTMHCRLCADVFYQSCQMLNV